LRVLIGDIDAAVTLPAVPLAAAFAVEALATFLLALVIVGVATDRRAAPGAAGLAIGLTVAADALAFGALTGASMNPARSLGPALLAGEYAALWLYVTAPIVGAALGMLAYEWLRRGTLRIKMRDALGALGPIGSAEEARS
ncbi:MAG: aquaporin, partial [Candidatus Thermoplasmatota archaeon]